MQNHFKSSLYQLGVTLVELMVVIAIVGIISSIAIPSYRGMVIDNRVESMASNLYSALVLARTEARNRGQVVTLCNSSNADAPPPAIPVCDGATATGWGTGWLVFVDTNNDGARANTEVLIKVQGQVIANAANGSIVSTDTNAGPVNSISFSATGQATRAIKFSINAPSNAVSSSKAVCVSLGGRAHIGKLTDC
ncbi:MAG: GspH/FimT family pseudopilin [Undibacterium sp.]|nr:GspH/FimT family pseudopilin [Undibacterium sp.]